MKKTLSIFFCLAVSYASLAASLVGVPLSNPSNGGGSATNVYLGGSSTVRVNTNAPGNWSIQIPSGVSFDASKLTKVLGLYNVKDYGAKGDGLTEDTPAIRLAVQAAGVAGGGTVYFPSGTYMVKAVNQDASIEGGAAAIWVTNSNIRLVGDGPWISTIKMMAFVPGTPSWHVFWFGGGSTYKANNITVESLTINGSWTNGLGSTGLSGTLLDFGPCTNIYVRNCSLVNACEHFIDCETVAQNIVLDSLYCTNSGSSGFHDLGASGSYTKVSKCYVAYAGFVRYSVQVPAYIAGTSYSLDGGLDTTAVSTADLDVEDCTFENNPVNVVCVYPVRFSHCRFVGSSTCTNVWLAGSTGGKAVFNSCYFDNRGAGTAMSVYSSIGGGSTQPGTGLFEGCVFDGGSIYLKNTAGTTFIGNQFNNSSTYMLAMLNATNMLIQGNTFNCPLYSSVLSGSWQDPFNCLSNSVIGNIFRMAPTNVNVINYQAQQVEPSYFRVENNIFTDKGRLICFGAGSNVSGNHLRDGVLWLGNLIGSRIEDNTFGYLYLQGQWDNTQHYGSILRRNNLLDTKVTKEDTITSIAYSEFNSTDITCEGNVGWLGQFNLNSHATNSAPSSFTIGAPVKWLPMTIDNGTTVLVPAYTKN